MRRPGLATALGNAGWLALDRLLRLAVGLIVTVWVARYLGPERFGQLNFALAFVALFGPFAGLGLKNILVRDIVRAPEGNADTVGSAFALAIIGGLLAYLLALVCITCLRPGNTEAITLVAIAGLVLLFRFGDVAAFWFEAQIRSKYVAWASVCAFLAFSLVKIVLILQEALLPAFAWASAGEVALIAVLSVIAFHVKGLGLDALRVSLPRAKGLLVDSWPLMLSGFSMMIYMKVDQVMLGFMAGDEEVGIYSAAARISELWYFIPMVIVASLFPSILKSREVDNKRYLSRLQSLCDLMAWLALVVALPVTFFSDVAITLIFGTGYANAGDILTVHVWAGLFVFLGVAGGRWYVAEGRQILNFYRKGTGAVVNIVLNWLLIPAWGGLGAAVATVLSYALVELFSDSWREETRLLFWIKLRALNFPLSGMRIIQEVNNGEGGDHQIPS